MDRIVDQVQRSFLGEAWHGPAFLEAIADVDAHAANTHIDGATHTIAEIVLHIRATVDILLGRIAGRAGPVDEDGFWPATAQPFDASSWHDLVADLKRRHDELITAIRGFEATQLDSPLFPGGSPALNNFLGHAQHNAYHAGQIMILKKQLAARPT